MPELQQLSADNGNTTWSFTYVDRRVALTLCAGWSDTARQTPCSAGDLFVWGSTTKPFTAAMIMRLVERGVVRLDDSAAAHIDPYLTARNRSDLVSLFGPAVRRVTLRHLLQMTAGIDEFDTPQTRQWQNTDANRGVTATPSFVLQSMNTTLLCEPGTCGKYSSTNYMLLGLVLARYSGASDWDKLDQRAWIARLPAPDRAQFDRMRYGSDVANMSLWMGWTCGNMVAPVDNIAQFFWRLLGPPSRDAATALLAPASVKEMQRWRYFNYWLPHGSSDEGPGRGGGRNFGYGLGLMNFTSMAWGFEFDGEFVGHNGLTYGFGAQSGYNVPLEFAMSLVTNGERWIGPDQHGQPMPLYHKLVQVVRRYRNLDRQKQ